MIYTVGHKENYLKYYKEHGQVTKRGKDETYNGGIAFLTEEDAYRWIREKHFENKFAVFEMDADWDIDTIAGDEPWWHYLLNDASIIIRMDD